MQALIQTYACQRRRRVGDVPSGRRERSPPSDLCHNVEVAGEAIQVRCTASSEAVGSACHVVETEAASHVRPNGAQLSLTVPAKAISWSEIIA